MGGGVRIQRRGLEELGEFKTGLGSMLEMAFGQIVCGGWLW